MLTEVTGVSHWAGGITAFQSSCHCGLSSVMCPAPLFVALDTTGMRRPVLIQALLGGGASVVLEGQRVVPSRTQDAGFRFQYNHVNQAIANIFR